MLQLVLQYAQSELGDLVFVNLPEEGDSVSVGEAFGDVESVRLFPMYIHRFRSCV